MPTMEQAGLVMEVSRHSLQIFHHREEMFRAKEKMGMFIIDISLTSTLLVMYDNTCHFDVNGRSAP